MLGLGSSSQLGIGIAIKLHDQFSGAADKVASRLRALKNDSSQLAMGVVRDYRNQAASIAGISAAVTYGMISMAKEGAEVQHKINQVAVVGGKELGKSREQLMKFATQFSKSFTSSPEDNVSAMFENAKAGITQGMEEITKYQVAVATATDEAIGGEGGVANQLLTIMNAMDIPTSKFKDIANGITVAANASMASVHSIGESMHYAAFTAHQFNVPLAETLALTAKLSQAGIVGSSAGTGINNMMLMVSGGLGKYATKKQKKYWRDLGLNRNEMRAEVNKGGQGIFHVIEALDKATMRLNLNDKADVLGRLFNRRGGRAMAGMFESKNGHKSIEDFTAEIQAGIKGDAAMVQSKAMMNDLSSDFKFLHNAVQRFKIAFVTQLGPTIRVLTHGLISVVNVLSKLVATPIGKVFIGLTAVAVPLIGIMFAFRAAILTATIALNGFSFNKGVGGFGGILQGGMGAAANAGIMGRFGSMVKVNKAGNLYRAATGQFVGGFAKGAFSNLAMNGGKAAATTAKATEGIASVSGKFLPALGTIGSFASKAIPVLGAGFLIYEIIKNLYEWFTGKDSSTKRNDPMVNDYYRNLDQLYMGYSKPDAWYNKNNMPGYKQAQAAGLNQSININVAGTPMMQQQLNQKLDGILASELNFDVNQP